MKFVRLENANNLITHRKDTPILLGLQVAACFCTKFINMKNLFFSISRAVVLLALFTFCSTALLAQTSCASNPGCTNPSNLGLFINIPNFTSSTCKILLTYKEINCNGVVNIYDFEYAPLGSNCNNFIDSLMTKPDFARRVDVLAGRQVADYLASQAIFNQGSDLGDFVCNGTTPKVVEVSYYRAKCISFWTGSTTFQVTVPGIIKIIKNQGPGIFPYEALELSILIGQSVTATVSCKGDGCCKLTRTYCLQKGKLTADEKTSSSNPGNNSDFCPFLPPPAPSSSYSYYDNVLWTEVSPCVGVCDNIPPSGKVISNVANLTDDVVMFFRNPIEGNLIVNFNEEVVGFIDIQDINGRLEKRVPVNQDRSIEIDLFGLSSGMYYVVLQHKDGRIETQKLVKQ